MNSNTDVNVMSNDIKTPVSHVNVLHIKGTEIKEKLSEGVGGGDGGGGGAVSH